MGSLLNLSDFSISIVMFLHGDWLDECTDVEDAEDGRKYERTHDQLRHQAVIHQDLLASELKSVNNSSHLAQALLPSVIEFILVGLTLKVDDFLKLCEFTLVFLHFLLGCLTHASQFCDFIFTHSTGAHLLY